jgi:hypothetical protein
MATRRALPISRVLSAAVLALVLAACGGGDNADGSGTPTPSPAAASMPAATAPPDAATATAPTDTSTAAGGPVVTLITAGEEPHTELRYQIANRHPVDATVRQEQELTQTIDGQSSEVALTTLFDIVGGVQTDGDVFTMRASLENYRLGDDTDPAIRDAVQDSISAFNGVTIVETFDSSGHSLERTIENPDEFGGDPATMSMLESLLQQNAFSNPLPTEPVGVGARWSSAQEVDVQGIPITQITETELVSMDGNVVELAFTTAQEVPSGAMTLEGVPGEVEIDTWDVTGEGTSVVDLTSPVPTTQGRTRARQKMTSTADDSTLEQDIVTRIELAPND